MDLVLYTADPLTRARTWAELNEDERKRRAVTACRDKDEPELWAIFEAYMSLHGQQGVKASKHTLKSYRLGFSRGQK